MKAHVLHKCPTFFPTHLSSPSPELHPPTVLTCVHDSLSPEHSSCPVPSPSPGLQSLISFCCAAWGGTQGLSYAKQAPYLRVAPRACSSLTNACFDFMPSRTWLLSLALCHIRTQYVTKLDCELYKDKGRVLFCGALEMSFLLSPHEYLSE